MSGGERLASVCVPELRDEEQPGSTRKWAAELLDAAPRVAVAGPSLCRVDARGWERRGGEEGLARRLHRTARRAGRDPAGVGIAETGVTADAAARLALLREEWGGDVASRKRGGESDRTAIVPAGEEAAFLAPLPVGLLPIAEATKETLRTLGLSRIGKVADRDREEMEARFGPEGIRLHRWAQGKDERVFPSFSPEAVPSASMELDGAVRDTEPLLFVLRRLLGRLCEELAGEGRCAARLTLRLEVEDGEALEETVTPARPTRREELLHDLCRAALERVARNGSLPGATVSLSLWVPERAEPEVRQRDLFEGTTGDPVRARAALSRLVARWGEDAVARPASRADHLPERRSVWTALEADAGGAERASGGDKITGPPLPGVLRLLADPDPVSVNCEDGRPVAVRDAVGDHEVVAAEGPERLSGRWWAEPHGREYWWICTEAGELLWIAREHRGEGKPRWRLHGWWD